MQCRADAGHNPLVASLNNGQYLFHRFENHAFLCLQIALRGNVRKKVLPPRLMRGLDHPTLVCVHLAVDVGEVTRSVKICLERTSARVVQMPGLVEAHTVIRLDISRSLILRR